MDPDLHLNAESQRISARVDDTWPPDKARGVIQLVENKVDPQRAPYEPQGWESASL